MVWAYTLQLLSCWLMLGIIWMVQLIVYPSFHSLNSADFLEAHDRHSFRITFLVGPAMVLELLTAIMLFYFSPAWWWGLNLAAVIALWLWTFFVSVPLHNRLRAGQDHPTIASLVFTNWPRTLLWSARAAALPLLMHVWN